MTEHPLRAWSGNAGDKGLPTLVAAPSARRAVLVLAERGLKISAYEFRGWWSETGINGYRREGVWQKKGRWRAVRQR